jgi:hypothetical protein
MEKKGEQEKRKEDNQKGMMLEGLKRRGYREKKKKGGKGKN